MSGARVDGSWRREGKGGSWRRQDRGIQGRVKETVAKGREIPRSDMGKSDERGRHKLPRRYVLRCRVESALRFCGLPTLGAATDATDRRRMHGVPDDRSPDRRSSLRQPTSMYVGF